MSAALAGAAPKLFPMPAAYTWYRWWTSSYGTHPDECCLSAGVYAGENPLDGATITYYLPRASDVRVEVRDGAGTLVPLLSRAGRLGR